MEGKTSCIMWDYDYWMKKINNFSQTGGHCGMTLLSGNSSFLEGILANRSFADDLAENYESNSTHWGFVTFTYLDNQSEDSPLYAYAQNRSLLINRFVLNIFLNNTQSKLIYKDYGSSFGLKAGYGQHGRSYTQAENVFLQGGGSRETDVRSGLPGYGSVQDYSGEAQNAAQPAGKGYLQPSLKYAGERNAANSQSSVKNAGYGQQAGYIIKGFNRSTALQSVLSAVESIYRSNSALMPERTQVLEGIRRSYISGTAAGKGDTGIRAGALGDAVSAYIPAGKKTEGIEGLNSTGNTGKDGTERTGRIDRTGRKSEYEGASVYIGGYPGTVASIAGNGTAKKETAGAVEYGGHTGFVPRENRFVFTAVFKRNIRIFDIYKRIKGRGAVLGTEISKQPAEGPYDSLCRMVFCISADERMSLKSKKGYEGFLGSDTGNVSDAFTGFNGRESEKSAGKSYFTYADPYGAGQGNEGFPFADGEITDARDYERKSIYFNSIWAGMLVRKNTGLYDTKFISNSAFPPGGVQNTYLSAEYGSFYPLYLELDKKSLGDEEQSAVKAGRTSPGNIIKLLKDLNPGVWMEYTAFGGTRPGGKDKASPVYSDKFSRLEQVLVNYPAKKTLGHYDRMKNGESGSFNKEEGLRTPAGYMDYGGRGLLHYASAPLREKTGLSAAAKGGAARDENEGVGPATAKRPGTVNADVIKASSGAGLLPYGFIKTYGTQSKNPEQDLYQDKDLDQNQMLQNVPYGAWPGRAGSPVYMDRLSLGGRIAAFGSVNREKPYGSMLQMLYDSIVLKNNYNITALNYISAENNEDYPGREHDKAERSASAISKRLPARLEAAGLGVFGSISPVYFDRLNLILQASYDDGGADRARQGMQFSARTQKRPGHQSLAAETAAHAIGVRAQAGNTSIGNTAAGNKSINAAINAAAAEYNPTGNGLDAYRYVDDAAVHANHHTAVPILNRNITMQEQVKASGHSGMSGSAVRNGSAGNGSSGYATQDALSDAYLFTDTMTGHTGTEYKSIAGSSGRNGSGGLAGQRYGKAAGVFADLFFSLHNNISNSFNTSQRLNSWYDTRISKSLLLPDGIADISESAGYGSLYFTLVNRMAAASPFYPDSTGTSVNGLHSRNADAGIRHMGSGAAFLTAEGSSNASASSKNASASSKPATGYRRYPGNMPNSLLRAGGILQAIHMQLSGSVRNRYYGSSITMPVNISLLNNFRQEAGGKITTGVKAVLNKGIAGAPAEHGHTYNGSTRDASGSYQANTPLLLDTGGRTAYGSDTEYNGAAGKDIQAGKQYQPYSKYSGRVHESRIGRNISTHRNDFMHEIVHRSSSGSAVGGNTGTAVRSPAAAAFYGKPADTVLLKRPDNYKAEKAIDIGSPPPMEMHEAVVNTAVRSQNKAADINEILRDKSLEAVFEGIMTSNANKFVDRVYNQLERRLKLERTRRGM